MTNRIDFPERLSSLKGEYRARKNCQKSRIIRRLSRLTAASLKRSVPSALARSSNSYSCIVVQLPRWKGSSRWARSTESTSPCLSDLLQLVDARLDHGGGRRYLIDNWRNRRSLPGAVILATGIDSATLIVPPGRLFGYPALWVGKQSVLTRHDATLAGHGATTSGCSSRYIRNCALLHTPDVLLSNAYQSQHSIIDIYCKDMGKRSHSWRDSNPEPLNACELR